MKDETIQSVEAAIALVKGWIRPIVVLIMTVIVCIMTYEGRLTEISWEFWAIYGGFASIWLGEGTLNKILQVRGERKDD